MSASSSSSSSTEKALAIPSSADLELGSRYAAVHVKPAGPGDDRPTASRIISDQSLSSTSLSHLTILITGCSSGLGVETARALHQTGATLYLTVRDVKKGEEVKQQILSDPKAGKGEIHLIALELDSLASVRSAAAEFLKQSGGKLNILITNAGVMATPEGVTKDGFETQFGTNHLSHFLLFLLLKDALLASSSSKFQSRVITLSSSGHRNSGIHFDDLNLKKQGYDPWKAYGQSKTANIYMALEIERRFGKQGLHANAVHPGGIITNLGRHMEKGVLESMVSRPGFSSVMKNVEQGAATTVWAAVATELEGKGGFFLENVAVSPPKNPADVLPIAVGYAPHAYDFEAAKKLYDISIELVGWKEEKAQ